MWESPYKLNPVMISDRNSPMAKLHVFLRGPLPERSHLKDLNLYWYKVKTKELFHNYRHLYLILYDNVCFLTHLRVYIRVYNFFFFLHFLASLLFLLFFCFILFFLHKSGGAKAPQPLPLRGPCDVLIFTRPGNARRKTPPDFQSVAYK